MRTLRLVIDGDLIYLFLQTVKTILGERVKTVNLIKQKAFASGDGIVDSLEDNLIVLSDGIVDSLEDDLVVLGNGIVDSLEDDLVVFSNRIINIWRCFSKK